MIFTKLLSISNHRVLTQKNRYIDPVGFKKKKIAQIVSKPCVQNVYNCAYA